MSGTTEIWGWIETEKGKLTELGIKMACETVRLSKQTGSQPCAVVSADSMKELDQLKKYGVSKVYALAITTGEQMNDRDSIQGLSQLLYTMRPRFLLLAANSFGNEWAARLSIRFEADVLGEVVDYAKSKGKLQLRKKVYGGKADALFTVEHDAFSILTISLASLDKLEQSVRELEIVPVGYRSEPSKIMLLKDEPLHWSEIPLHEADFIIGVGRGVKKEAMASIHRLAEMWNCSIGGSKVADESGLIAREYRIGASGKTISCNIYLAIGISGAPHHLAGIKDVRHLTVINPDLTVPIAERAELVIGFPYEQVVPLILQSLQEKQEVVS